MGQVGLAEQTCPGTKQPVSPEGDAFEGAEMKCRVSVAGVAGEADIQTLDAGRGGRWRDAESGREREG